MNNLTHTDYQKILRAVEILNSDVDPKSLPQRMRHSVNHAVASDITAFEFFNQAFEHQGILIYEPSEAVSAEELEVYAQYLHEHPFIPEIVVRRRFDAITVSDFMSDAQFKHTGIYNEYYRPVGVERQISVTMNINQDCLIVCTLSRSRKDFDLIEKSILNLMSPHFTTAVRNANSFESLLLKEQNWQSVAESMGRAIIVLDLEGKTKYLSDHSASLLQKYFGGEKLKIHDLPHTLYQWTKKNYENCNSQEYRLPPKPLVLTEKGEKLIVRFKCSKNLSSINLLLDEEKQITPKHLIFLGLTKREAEILFWIIAAKTNVEISFLCDISPRTVQKHIEHICTKLGVENRTAAAVKAKEIIH